MQGWRGWVASLTVPLACSAANTPATTESGQVDAGADRLDGAAPHAGGVESIVEDPAWPLLGLAPNDLMTGGYESPLIAMIQHEDERPIEEGVLASVAAQLELHELAGLKRVEAEVVLDLDGRMGRVQLHPKVPLHDTWYVMSLRRHPGGVRFAGWPARSPPTGVHAVRFRIGSEPILRAVRFCENDAEPSRVGIVLSENARTTTHASIDTIVGVEQPSTKATCRFSASEPEPDAMVRIQHTCTGFDRSDALRRIYLRPGLVNLSGAPVHGFGGGDVDLIVDLSKLPPSYKGDDPGCKLWTP
jgi:hypothetical protein